MKKEKTTRFLRVEGGLRLLTSGWNEPSAGRSEP